MKTEWIEFGLPYWRFASQKLNKPGTLVDVDSKIYLIGHINPLSGICDCCIEFDDEAIVKRYKVIWEELNERT